MTEQNKQTSQPFAWYWYDQHGCLYITGDDRKPDLPADAKPLYATEQNKQSDTPAPAQLVVGACPEGWTIVPIEPTPEMEKAGESWSGLPSATWAEMLDAAPEPPNQITGGITNPDNSVKPVDPEDEAYEIGKRDGYSEAVQEIDQLTGGDGEYRYCLGGGDPDRHTPGPVEMIRRIVDRFEVLNLLDEATKTGRDQPDDSPSPETRAAVPMSETTPVSETDGAAIPERVER